MTVDPETIAIYDAQAAEYARITANDARDQVLVDFIAALPKGAHVLDLGCGPGQAAAEMALAGMQVTATDASAEMVAMAARHPGVTAVQATFAQIEGHDLYDAIWANFCLLHAPRTDMARHLAALKAALKPGGRFHIGLKTGTGEHRDGIGRLYTYYQIDELTSLLATAGFTVFETTTGEGAGLSGEIAPWVTVAAHG